MFVKKFDEGDFLSNTKTMVDFLLNTKTMVDFLSNTKTMVELYDGLRLHKHLQLDSDTSHHMTSHQEWFRDLRTPDQPNYIET